MAIYKDTTKTKDGRQWYFKVYKKDFEGNSKPYKSKRYLTKKEAQDAEALFILKRDNPVHKLFKIVAKEYLDNIYKIRKESTGYSYEKDYNLHIKPYFEKFNIDEITISQVREWKDTLEKKDYSIKYLNGFYSILNGIFNYGVKYYGLPKNPIQTIGRFEKRNDDIIESDTKLRYITLEQFNQFIEVVDSILWKAFFTTLFYTGVRKGEAQALTWKDIDFNNDEIIINKTLTIKSNDNYKITTTKNYINRKIKMSKTLKEILIEYKNQIMHYKDFSNDWFVFGNTRFLSQTSIDRYKHFYFQKANLEKEEITIHEFRHSHVSLLINEYVKLGQTDTAKFFLMMSNRMGHSIQVMQTTYMHLFPTIQNEIVDMLNNL